MSADPEAYPVRTVRPKARRQAKLELVPASADLFADALRRPSEEFIGLTHTEMLSIRNKGRDAASSHFLTTVLLRLAGDATTIDDYGFYRLNLRYDQDLRHKVSSKPKALAESANRLDKAAKRAQPYTEMLGIVDMYMERYRQAYDSATTTERSELISAIHEKSADITHPALTYIHGTTTVEQAREIAIEGERILRIMLIDDRGWTQ